MHTQAWHGTATLPAESRVWVEKNKNKTYICIFISMHTHTCMYIYIYICNIINNRTPKLLFCNSFCVKTSRRASATSEQSITASPIQLSSPAPRVAAAVPEHMPITVRLTSADGL